MNESCRVPIPVTANVRKTRLFPMKTGRLVDAATATGPSGLPVFPIAKNT